MVPCHAHPLHENRRPENICDAPGCENHLDGTWFRCTDGCDFDVCRSCWDKLSRILHAHPLCPDRRATNICDRSGCGKHGTSFRCSEGCDFDVCHDCWELSRGERLTTSPESITGLNQDRALVVVRREAELRCSESYLSQTRPYVLRGQVPPVELYQECQARALAEFGFKPDATTIQAYQALVRELPTELRRDVFFLHANDRLFHPEIDAEKMMLGGHLMSGDGCIIHVENWLTRAKQEGCIKLFLIASTST